MRLPGISEQAFIHRHFVTDERRLVQRHFNITKDRIVLKKFCASKINENECVVSYHAFLITVPCYLVLLSRCKTPD